MNTSTDRGTAAKQQLNIRVDVQTRDLIDAAVSVLKVDRTSFILDAASKRAQEVIMDQQVFQLSDEAFDRFEEALNANPLSENTCLQTFLKHKPRWR
ncbi:DUF1778 domain-containing protein [Pseudomonas syringae]|nr:DUF1778 domain-containing protein [Pseudomonas syringae]MBD8803201.1 DUF1778 domain-containing protein [Pseudomonas syringae]MBD8814021.1 DUF1778 domain-containing protein [Pseudomonas syringae]